MRTLRVLLALLATPAVAISQDTARLALPDLPIATRVRLQAEGMPERYLIGKVAGMDQERLRVTVNDDGTTVVVPWSSITALSFSQGNNRASGARKGVLLGFLGGIVLFASLIDKAEASTDTAVVELLGAAAFELVPLISAGIGAALANEQWFPVSWPRPALSAAKFQLDLVVNDEFRISTSRGPARGRFVSADRDTLVLRRGGTTSRIAWQDLTAIRARNEPDRLYGALIGASIFAGAVAVQQSFAPSTRGGEALVAFTAFGVAGAFIGSYFAPRQWILLPLPRP